MGDEEEPLVGFSWRGGFERDTTGILMWSKPFITTLPSGDEVSQSIYIKWKRNTLSNKIGGSKISDNDPPR